MPFRRIIMVACLSCIIAAGGSFDASAQQVGIKTNALMWTALTPNFGCEIVTGEHTSFDFSLFGNVRPYGLHARMVGLQPEFKYWFNGRPMVREFIGVAMLYANYDFNGRRQVYDGDALGLGITAGYVFAIGKRWSLELSASYGLAAYSQKQYMIWDNYNDYYMEKPPKNNSYGYICMPVDIGVNFTYIIR